MKNFIFQSGFPLFIFCICLNLGCQKSTLSVVSGPEKATVSILDPESGVAKQIGLTPLTINEKTELPPAIRDARIWSISLHKKGHVVEHILLDRSATSSYKISSNLKKSTDWMGEDNQVVSDMADKIGRSLKEVYIFINAQNYSGALKKIDSLIDSFPKSAIFYDIKGSVHFLRGEREKAISSYQKSLQLNPNSPETSAALAKLQGRSSGL